MAGAPSIEIIDCRETLESAVVSSNYLSLGEAIDDSTENSGWVDDAHGFEGASTVCVNDRGTTPGVPFTLDDFWETISELDAEVTVHRRVGCVGVRHPRHRRDQNRDHIPGRRLVVADATPKPYPYQRGVKSSATFAWWLRNRFKRHYPGYTLAVSSAPVPGQTRIATLRMRNQSHMI